MRGESALDATSDAARGSRHDPGNASAESPPAPAPSGAAATTGRAPPSSDATATSPALSIAALEHRLETAEPGTRDLVLADALPAMLQANVLAVARFAELQSDPALRERLIRETADHWVKREPERAMDWVRTLPPSPEREATLIDMSLAIARTDPARAATIRDGDVGNETPDGVLDGIVQQWAERDFDAAQAWTNARPRNAQYDQLTQRLVHVRAAAGDFDGAIRIAKDASTTFDAKAAALTVIAREMLRHGDADAVDRLLDGLDPALKDRVQREYAITH